MIAMDLSQVISIIVAAFGSSGLWALVSSLLNRRSKQTAMLIGLAHDRICYLGDKFIERGYITRDEFENLSTYLYEPYEALGGNGTAQLVMEKVRKLPFHE